MKSSLILLLTFLTSFTYSQTLELYGLTCEHKNNPMGIEAEAPRLSWKIKGEGRNIAQSAYSIRVAESPSFSEGIVWESGKITSDESNLVPYAGPALQSTKRYYC